jgi:arginine decarboxylase
MSATAEGPTELAAFHEALSRLGIEDTNLLVLSSVIPTGSTVNVVNRTSRKFKYGNRIYVVLSQQSTIQLMTHVYAGLGWYQREDGSGYFVEHHGDSEESVTEKIKATLNHMQMLKNEKYPFNMEIKGTLCRTKPVCSIVVAVYEEADWKS